MKIQLLEQYFPLPILQTTLYRLTPVVAAEIEPLVGGYITVHLSPLTPAYDDAGLVHLFNQTLTAVAIADQAWQDYQYIRELHTRAALSYTEAEEQITDELAKILHGEAHTLTCWGRGQVSQADPQRLALMRQSTPLLMKVKPGEIKAVINTEAYPWAMILRAASRVQFNARVSIEATLVDTVTVTLEPQLDEAALAEWFQHELEQVEEIQPAQYPPVFSLSDTFVTAGKEEGHGN